MNPAEPSRPSVRPAIALLQLGGPDTLADVRPFLYNFFCDLLADNVPRVLIKPLAWLIATLRAPYSRALYASIGGGSPIRAQTQAQADALGQELRRRGRAWPVYVAMRNWRPDTASMLAQARRDEITHLVALPLYPQYSFATTRSSVDELRRVCASSGDPFVVRVIEEHCDEPSYVAAVARVTRRALADVHAPASAVHLIFSAHGLPVSYIEKGDPYLDHVKRTMSAVLQSVRHDGPTHLSFQSRLGPQRWLKPSTDELLRELGASGAKAVCIVPVAFVTEHVETLNEIDILYRSIAEQAGIQEFSRACAVKCDPAYITCLSDLAARGVDSFGSATDGERRRA